MATHISIKRAKAAHYRSDYHGLIAPRELRITTTDGRKLKLKAHQTWPGMIQTEVFTTTPRHGAPWDETNPIWDMLHMHFAMYTAIKRLPQLYGIQTPQS
jgi:hypothetical protein